MSSFAATEAFGMISVDYLTEETFLGIESKNTKIARIKTDLKQVNNYFVANITVKT